MIKFGMKRNLYFTFDTTHVATFEHEVIDAFLAYHKTGRLKHVHVSDHASERSHLFPGAGNLPLAALLRTMHAAGYDLAVSLEVAPDELPSMRGHLKAVLREALLLSEGTWGKRKTWEISKNRPSCASPADTKPTSGWGNARDAADGTQ